ncbi:MAG: exodeoxyribonuclease III [Planctomycetota bacterium]
MISIYSWNVNGIRAILKKDFENWVKQTQPDILCLQETKATEDQVSPSITEILKYDGYWSSAEKKGYSGVATFCKSKPLKVETGLGIAKFDNEGRVVRTEFLDFILYNVYFPNGQQSEARLQYKLEFFDCFMTHLQETRKRQKNLIICGDYNIAHKEIDLRNPEANSQYSGFLPQERAILDRWISLGYLDTFREFNAEPEHYSWWSYRFQARKKNIGWRIDYFFVTEALKSSLQNAKIHMDVLGSDHCPVSLTLNLDLPKN